MLKNVTAKGLFGCLVKDRRELEKKKKQHDWFDASQENIENFTMIMFGSTCTFYFSAFSTSSLSI